MDFVSWCSVLHYVDNRYPGAKLIGVDINEGRLELYSKMLTSWPKQPGKNPYERVPKVLVLHGDMEKVRVL